MSRQFVRARDSSVCVGCFFILCLIWLCRLMLAVMKNFGNCPIEDNRGPVGARFYEWKLLHQMGVFPR